MNMAFKFRFVNEITGIFVMLALLALAAGVFLAGRAQGLFEPTFQLHTVFTTDEGSFGLKRGAEVRIRDTTAGSVIRVEPDAEGNIQATFQIKENFHGFVRTSSRAVVRKTLIVTGDAYVEILVGNRNDPRMPDGAMIECGKDTEIIEQAMQLLEELREQTIPALVKLQEFLDELPAVVTQARLTLQATETLLRDDVPAVTLQAQDTLRETGKLLNGLQQHWLLRKYMPPEEHRQLLAPGGARP
ncbi:MAG: MlaD family protein [Kiritimatiellia bacterium]|nr:MlaD family protein [Lentisphaerota bacterium]